MASLTSLPPELIACILDFIPSIDLQQTTISLLPCLSYAFVPICRHFLFYHVHLKSPESVDKLFEHLQQIPSDATLVQKFSLATWTVDSRIAVDLILMLSNLKWLSLCVGESFSLEDMEKLFREPMPNLRCLSFQYRPVMESNRLYPQNPFLAGTNTRSVFEVLARWPTSDPLAVSLITDLPKVACIGDLYWQQAEFLGLFNIVHLPLFVYSPLMERTRVLRMRYVWGAIVNMLHLNQPATPCLPPLTFLDLSTCNISVNDVHFLLKNLRCLHHLILDECDTLADDLIEGWAAFGHDCLMINNGLGLDDKISQAQLSPATVHVLPSHPVAPTTPIVGSRPSRASILPWSSKLRTLALSAPRHADSDEQRSLVAAFLRGWGEAVTEINDRLRAVRQSRSKGMQTLRFISPGEDGNHTGHHGIVVVDDDEFAHFSKLIDVDDYPVVCLAGQAGGIEHAEGCAHSIGWDIWEDTL